MRVSYSTGTKSMLILAVKELAPSNSLRDVRPHGPNLVQLRKPGEERKSAGQKSDHAKPGSHELVGFG